ncbi:MAG: hypothetical protein ACYCW6_30950 [Candidatus Xenobia bacterium]
MLKIFRQQLGVQLTPEQFRELSINLSHRFPPLISGIKREYWKKIGLPGGTEDIWINSLPGADEQSLMAGEIYLIDPDTLLYFKAPRPKAVLEAGIITRKDPASYADFFSTIKDQLRELIPEFPGEWQPVGRNGLATPMDEGTVLPRLHPSRQEVESAEELEGDMTRELLSHILQKGQCFLGKLVENRDKATTERMVARFDRLGMITRDYAVLCSKTGQQILRVASREAIEDPSHKTFKCFICGKSISEETVDEIITASDYGRRLLESDYWLLVRVVGAMQRLGISEDDITIRQDDSLHNLFVTINQEAYLYVLANRKLGLPDANIVSAHVAAFELDHVVLVSNEKVPGLLRHHLERTNSSCDFSVVDSLKGLEDRFESILKEKEKRVLRDTLDSFATLTPVPIQDLIMARVAPDAQPAPEQTQDEKVEAGKKTRAKAAAGARRSGGGGVATVEEAPPPAEPPAPAQPAEEESFYMEEVIPEDTN